MADDKLSFLEEVHEIYKAHEASWQRDERRLYGGDAILSELHQWTNEDENHYAERQAEAQYMGFGEQHANEITGHLIRAAPMPNFGTMGEIRKRKDIIARPTAAELFFYNTDGIGFDGTQWFPFWQAEGARAMATGHRFHTVEMPPPPLGKQPGDLVTDEEREDGHRPYLAGWSPLALKNWQHSHGRLDFAVLRPVVPKKREPKEKYKAADSSKLGYYLLVRRGWTEFGPEFEGGGWWLYDGDKVLVGEGDYEMTGGHIPAYFFYARASNGTHELPAISQSLTMPLDQISVGVMNRISERDFDAKDAAQSNLYVLGAESKSLEAAVAQMVLGSRIIPFPPWRDPVTGQLVLPQIHDGSTGTVAAEVYRTSIASSIENARGIMLRQVTSTPDSSGASKEAGFKEGKSPLLANLAANLESAMNAAIYFAERRNGAEKPTGSVEMPRDFDIASLVEKIDRAMERAIKSGVRSPLHEAESAVRQAQEEGTLPSDPARVSKIQREFEKTAALVVSERQGAVMKVFTDSGVPMDIAARLAGLDAAIVTELGDATVPLPNDPATDGTVFDGGSTANGNGGNGEPRVLAGSTGSNGDQPQEGAV
jgi:hypothetical protein